MKRLNRGDIQLKIARHNYEIEKLTIMLDNFEDTRYKIDFNIN